MGPLTSAHSLLLKTLLVTPLVECLMQTGGQDVIPAQLRTGRDVLLTNEFYPYWYG